MTSSIEDISNKLRVLNDQFTANLSQYQTISADYKSAVASQAAISASTPIDASANSTINGTIGATVIGKAELYATIPHSTYWGQTGLSEGAAHSPTECLADCYNKPACTGATFDADTNYCWIRTGDGRIAPGKQNQTAIIKKTILYEYQLKILADKMHHINSQITDLITANAIIIDNNEHLREQKREILERMRLLAHTSHAQMDILQTRHDTIAEADQNSALLVNQNYYRYILYLFGAILLGILLFKIMLIPDAPSGSVSMMGGSHINPNLVSAGLSFAIDTVESVGELFL